MKTESLIKLYEAVISQDVTTAVEAAQESLGQVDSPRDILGVIAKAGEELGRLYENGEYFLPELFGGADAMSEAVDAILPELKKRGGSLKGVVVMGTVEGDIHDIGKRIICAMLAGSGFEVHDLGINVQTQRFVEEARAVGADVVGASSCFSTTTFRLRELGEALLEAGMGESVSYLIGGAGMVEWAHADGHGDNAAEAVRLVKAIVREGTSAHG
jgi:methanogenic corrinoid protein MtbC1